MLTNRRSFTQAINRPWRSAPGLLFRLALLILVMLLSFPLRAQEPSPRIGLVLGGGGARGIAHIGVLKVLDEMRVPVSCIAGTSMGSLVGGVYASGVSVNEMERLVGQVVWEDLFTDDPPRSEKPFRAKRDDFENLFDLELGQRGTHILLPPGSTGGYKFEFKIREILAQSGNYADWDFDKLPIPFRALATDIEQGVSKQFNSGDLVKVIRASLSVPGAISPVDIDGTLYVDGGLLQNLPVQAARDTCADVVIAVNVGSGLLPREELNSALGVSLQMINVLTEQNVRESIASLGNDDILIEPKLGGYSAVNFNQAMSLIPIGERAARAQADKLQRYALSEEAYRRWRASVQARLPSVPEVEQVAVATTGGRVNAEVIERELAEVPGIDLRRRPESDFSLRNLNTRLEQVYGRGDFERMDYKMVDRQGVRTVEVEGVEKSWGPNYVKFGFGFAADSDQTRFNANLSHRSTWINSRGAEWRNDLQIGYRDRLTSEFYQPFSSRAGFFIAPRLDVQQEPITYFLEGKRIGEYRVTSSRGHLDLGYQNKYGELRLGFFSGHLNAQEDFGLMDGVPDYSLHQAGYTTRVIFDQIDDPNFGYNGLLAMLNSRGTLGKWGSHDEYNKTELFLMGAKSVGNHSFELSGLIGRTLRGELPAYDPFLLGGFLRGSGYRMDELLGERVDLLRTVYSYKIASLPQPLGRGVYVGGSLEATRGAMGTEVDAEAQIRRSASLFIAADTFLGPAYLSWGQVISDGGEGTLYFMLGRP
jgi:NTE family protein